MKIVYSSSGVQQGRETENRDAAIAHAASMIPTEDDTTATAEGGLDNE